MRKIINNKKGILMKTLIEILVAALCVLGLASLLINIWFASSKDTNYKKAEASLNDVVFAEIQRLNEGGFENPSGVLVPNPSGWEIIGFTEDVKPNSCFNENCICICDIFFGGVKSQATKCDKDGVCKIVSDLVSFDTIKIERTGTSIFVKKTENGIEVTK